jgi:hypothetical protein
MRCAAASAVLVLASLTSLGSGVVAASPAGTGPVCSLITIDEIAQAFGGKKWQLAEDGDAPTQCYLHNGLFDRKSKALSIRLESGDEFLWEDFRQGFIDSYPETEELEMEGFPVIYEGGSLNAWLGPDAWLTVTVITDARKDEAKVKDLAEIMVGRLASNLSTPAEPVESTGLCTVVTVEQVSAAIGETLSVIEDTPDACAFAGDMATGSLTGLVINLATGDPMVASALLDELRAAFPEAAEIEVAGVPALQPEATPGAPGWLQSQLIVLPDEGTVLFLTATTPEAVDTAAALVTIAEAALTGLATMTSE